ncbi:unnamed protein product [Auanema sp. JU1783]|nr:unnamed protein product [Auanema sp. JU1783]
MSATISVNIMSTKPLDTRTFRVSERLRQRKQKAITSEDSNYDDGREAISDDDDDYNYNNDERDEEDSFNLDDDDDDDIQIIESHSTPPVLKQFVDDHLPPLTFPDVNNDFKPSIPEVEALKPEIKAVSVHIPLPGSELVGASISSSNQSQFDSFVITVPQATLKSKTSDITDSNDIRLRCHHPKCDKLVRGNYAYINHIWAHFAVESCSFRSFSNCNSGRRSNPTPDKLDFRGTCPYCFLKYETPFFLQRHISTTHTISSEVIAATICSICDVEVDSDPKKLIRHMRLVHNKREAPYNCKLCFFGAGEKCEMWKHFLTKHTNSHALMCPICIEIFVIPSNKKRNMENSGREFYEHFLSHITENQNDCSECPCFFSNPSSAHDHHVRAHSTDLRMKWAIRHRNDELRNNVRSQIQRVFFSGNDCPRCTTLNAKTQIKEYTPRCINCITNYIKSHCRASNYYIDRRYSVDYVYRCNCGYVSRDVRDTAIHSRVHEHLQIQIEYNPIAQSAQTEEQRKADDFELDLFQIVHRPLKVMKRRSLDSSEDVIHEIRKRVESIQVEENIDDLPRLNQSSAAEDFDILMQAYDFWMSEELRNNRKRKFVSQNLTDSRKNVVKEENSEEFSRPRRLTRQSTRSQISPPSLTPLASSTGNLCRDDKSSSPEIIVLDD